jgi:hypothetical protein
VLYEVHYLIVDSGNYRILELVTGYDQKGNIAEDPMVPGQAFDRVVVWASTTQAQGNKYSYSNALRTTLPEIDPAWPLYPVTVACVANTRFGTAGQPFSGGTILFLDSAPKIDSPKTGAPIEFGTTPINGSTILLPDGKELALSAPTHIDLFEIVGNITTKLENYLWLITDSTMVADPSSGNMVRVGALYIVYLSPSDGRLHLAVDSNGNWMRYVSWIDRLNGGKEIPFVHPTCAKRVASGEILVTDFGANAVVVFDPMTGEGAAIAPPVTGTDQLNQPTFADRSF